MKKELEYLVIHCTATPEGRKVSEKDIRNWHTSPKPKGNGWKQVGYTDMFHLDGSITRLVENNEDAFVDGWEVTNGASGYNSVSRHIVYVGGTDKQGKAKDTRTDEQKESLKKYVLDFHKRHPRVKIIGHNGISNKACPSFDVKKWLKEIGINQ